MLRYCLPSLVLFALLGTALAATARAQLATPATEVTRFDEIEDVIRAWRPERHVFVKGDIGVGTRQLQELQRWISDHAPHWTVVLMEHAAGESFRAADGRTYRGMDAVEYALGYGLSNRTDFGRLEHPQTKESDGAVFALFLRERKFSYFASDAQDRRGLGEANWIGQLDQPAFRAMRNGGRLLDAAKSTIETIDEQLARAIQSEVDAEQRANAERERAAARLARAITAARQRIAEVRMAAANFRLQHPTASGPLARPAWERWEETLAALESEATPDTARALLQRLSQVNDDIQRHLNGYASAQALADQAQRLAEQGELLRRSPAQVAAAQLSSAESWWAKAEQNYAAGNLGTDELLTQMEQALQRGQEQVAAERARRERARLRSLWIRRTVWFMLALVAAASALILALLNWRRRPAMREAQQELARRESSVHQETEGLNDLFVRAEEILGSRERVKKRGYVGSTLQVATQALDYVDDLFILSKEVRRVLQEARHLVYPAGILGKLSNLFSSGRYQRAIQHVSGKPLRFSRAGGMPLVLREQLSGADADRAADEISMTFEAVFLAFQQRGDDAQAALATIESCLTGIDDTLAVVQHDLEAVMAQEKDLALAAESDRYFDLPNFLDKLIPSIQEDVLLADELSAFDAVRAMQVPLPAARRKLNDAGRLTALLQTARQELFPQLTAAAEQLRQSDIASQWIDERLQKITADANLLLHTATQRAVADELESLAAELAEVGASAQRTVELVTSIEEQVQPRLEAFTQRVESVREQLADELKLPITAVLNEPDRDPDDWLAAAREYLQTARQTLALGRNDAAQSALEAMQAAETQAETLLQASAQAVKSFAQEQQRARAELRQLGERVPRIEQQLEPIQRAYVPAALGMHFTAAATELEQAWEMEPADAPRQPATATEPLRIGVGDLLQRAAAPVGEIERLLQQAAAEQSQGRVLHAADMQQQVAFMLGHSHQQLELAQRHLLAIDTQRQENESVLARLGNRVQELQELSRDPQIMQDTLGAITAARRTLDALRRDLAAPPPAPNPFEIERSLQTLDRTLLQLDARCQADRQAHAEAARGLAGARRQLQAAQQLVRQAQTDDIPDSRPTRQASRQIDALAGKLAELEADLRAAHGDWQQAAERSSQLQIDLRAAANTLGGELQHASRAFSEFQAAARAVMQAERWSGDYGLRVKGSPGAVELERARSVLQQGNYGAVIELTMRAASSATAAIQKAEREVARRRMAAAQEAERKRRRAARRSSTWGSGSFGGGSFGGSSSRGGSFGGGSFGGSSSRGGSSGFKRSGW